MDAMNEYILDRLSELHPGCSIVVSPMFLGGPDSMCGRVPPEWNGKTIVAGNDGYYIKEK